MRIGYMGTPDFAVPSLRGLAGLGQVNGLPVEVVFAVSQPDKAKDRGKKVRPTPVKEAALELGIPVLQPERIKGNEEFLRELRDFAPDLIVVAAYGRILPVEVLELPPLGCVNIHGSLLPKYRGAAPIQRSILEGEAETGVTLMYMAEGLDTGDMIAWERTPIARKTADELHDELAVLGAKLLTETLPAIADGTAPRIAQDDELSCYAPMIFKQDGLVDWSRSAGEIDCQVRGLASWPGAFTWCQGQQMKIREAVPLAEAEAGKADGGPSEAGKADGGPSEAEACRGSGGSRAVDDAACGTVLAASDRGIDVKTGAGVLRILQVQFPGKRVMAAGDFLRGHRLEAGTILGEIQ